MSAADKPPVASISDCTFAFTVSDALRNALLALCETRGWETDEGLRRCLAYGVSFLYAECDPELAAEGQRAPPYADVAFQAQIAQLCAENARLCAENAQLRARVDQYQAGCAPGVATVDVPSPAWLSRCWP
jgi:hypothetical protein